MTVEGILAIVEQYQRYDWMLRRVLLPIDSFGLAEGLRDVYPGVEIIESMNAAMWFSRRSIPESESWEIRRIAPPAYAMVVVLPDEMSLEEKNELLEETEAEIFRRPTQPGN